MSNTGSADQSPRFVATLMGTGTSHGIPEPGCTCPVCQSSDPRDNRYRASLWIKSFDPAESFSVVIDASPEFRLQTVRSGVRRLDALLVTHAHADHIHGLDDIRAFCQSSRSSLPVYVSGWSYHEIRERFSYAFKDTPQPGGGKPEITLTPVEPYVPFAVGNAEFLPVEAMHGVVPVIGYRLGDFAYLTDVSAVPPRTVEALRGIRTLVLDGLRFRPHSTHFSIDQAIACAAGIGADRTFLTHICHESSHRELEKYCLEKTGGSVTPAFDGLSFDVR